MVKRLKVDVVEGDLQLEDGSILESTGEKIVVNGSLICKGDCEIFGTLECQRLRSSYGDIEVYGNAIVYHEVKVKKGSLYIEGDLQARRVAVDKKLSIGGLFETTTVAVGGNLMATSGKAEDISVGGKVEIREKVHARSISVGGTLKCGSVEAERISVGGTVDCEEITANKISVGGTLKSEKISAERISVGGVVEFSEGEIKDKVSVGGSLKVSKSIKAGRIEVGGTIDLGEGKVDIIDVGGMLKVEEKLKAEHIDAGGMLVSKGFIEANDVDVGGALESEEDVRILNRLDVGGSVTINGLLDAGRISVGSRLYAKKINAESIDATYLETEEGAWAKTVEIGENGKVKGVLVAEEVYLNEKASAETIYAKFLETEEKCRIRNVYACNISLRDKTIVSGELKYSENIMLGENVYIENGPTKVENIIFPKDC